jgi:hypothetical protein
MNTAPAITELSTASAAPQQDLLTADFANVLQSRLSRVGGRNPPAATSVGLAPLASCGRNASPMCLPGRVMIVCRAVLMWATVPSLPDKAVRAEPDKALGADPADSRAWEWLIRFRGRGSFGKHPIISRPRRVSAVVGLILLLCQASGVPAGAAETRVALVIGASAYMHASHLPNTLNDARELANKLKNLGFAVETVTDPDRPQFEAAVRRFGQRAHGADAALFFYAGHALELQGRNWLIPVQANLQTERDLRFEAMDLSDVIEQIAGQARVSLVILDACRNNPFKQLLGPESRGSDLGGGLAPQRAAMGTLIVYSTALGEVAADGNGPHSPFTAALLRHIETPGIEVRQLIGVVRRDVRQATFGHQIPWESSALEGEFFLDPTPVPAPEPNPAPGLRDAEVVLWDSVKDSHDPADLQLYITRYPNGMFAPLARSRFAQRSNKPAAPENLAAPGNKVSPIPGRPSAGASYQGAYFCGRRVARVTLKVFPQVGEVRRHAMLSFGPEPTSPDVPRGAFIVEGSIDVRGGAMALEPVKWVSRPAGYSWIGLTGRSDDGGKTFSGRIVNNDACTVFTLRRIGDTTAAR